MFEIQNGAHNEIQNPIKFRIFYGFNVTLSHFWVQNCTSTVFLDLTKGANLNLKHVNNTI